MLKGKSHFINGKWITGQGDCFSSIDPSNENIIWEGNEATINEVDHAVLSAKKAFKSWRVKSLDERIEQIKSFQKTLFENKDTLAETISKETGKPLFDSLQEVDAMINKINISISANAVRCKDIVKKLPQARAICRHLPHGALAVFGPFNFPGHLPNGHMIPALLAGNTIIFKPSDQTPLTSLLIVHYWQKSGLPNGVLNLVQGGKETGKTLSCHPEIDGLLFTGSWQTGKVLAAQFAKTPYKILALEMGGNNPLIIGKISDIRAAAYLTIQSAFITSGQRCTCARRLIVPVGKDGDAFIKELVRMSASIKVGAYNDLQEPFMGPVISGKAADSLIEKQSELLELGGHPCLPMARLTRSPAFLTPGIIDMTKVEKRPDGEFFGPLLQLIRVKNLKQAIEEANHTLYGLSAGLFSDSPDEYRQFYQEIHAGIINWNCQLTGASSEMPFGGIGRSGNLRPSAFYAADYSSYPVSSLENDTLRLPKTLTPGISL